MGNKKTMVKRLYNRILVDDINLEKKFERYVHNIHDKKIISLMLEDINTIHNMSYSYLAELLFAHPKSIADIICKYIWEIQSLSTKAYLVPLILADKKVKNKDLIFLKLYMEFRNSPEYIAPPGKPAPAHIYVRYDNAFSSISLKNIISEIVSLLQEPRNAFYLPLTMQKLSKAQNAEVYKLLQKYLNASELNPSDFNLPIHTEEYYPPYDFMKKQLVEMSQMFLKYYNDK